LLALVRFNSSLEPTPNLASRRLSGRGDVGLITQNWAATRPFTWKEIEAKFDKLAADHATEKSREEIKNAVRSLEDIQVSDLMKVLSAL
jgi:hypothetical protein